MGLCFHSHNGASCVKLTAFAALLVVLCTIVHGQESSLFEPLPQLKIAGTLYMARGEQNPEPSFGKPEDSPRFASPGSEKKSPLAVETLDEWMLGASIVTRARGERIQARQIQPSQRLGNLSHGNQTTNDRVPSLAVCGYQSDIMPGSAARKQVFQSGWEDGQAVSSAGDLSLADLPRMPHWMLQRVAYGLKNLPQGTTHTLTHEGSSSVLTVSWPPKTSGKDWSTAERAKCVWHEDQLEVTLYAKSWRKGETPQPEVAYQHVRYSNFDRQFPGVARRIDMQHTGSLPLVFEVTGIESLPKTVTYDQVVAEAGRGATRQFHQRAGHDDEKLTASVFQLVDGSKVRLRDSRDKFLLLHFWASWAPDNEKRFAEVKKICRNHARNRAFAAISVSLDDDIQSAQAVISKMKPDWPQAYLGPNADAVRGFPFESLPAAILVEPGENPRLAEISMGAIAVTTLFGKETFGQPKVDAVAAVADRLALAERRRKARGVYAEMFGKAGRDALLHCEDLRGFLVLHNWSDPDGDEFHAPQDAERVAGIPVVYRWPTLSRQAAQGLVPILMKDESYKYHRERMESDDPPSGPARVISFRHGGNAISFCRVDTDDGVALEPVIARSGEDVGWLPLLFPTAEANKEIDAWLAKWMPDTQETSAALYAKTSAWRTRKQK